MRIEKKDVILVILITKLLSNCCSVRMLTNHSSNQVAVPTISDPHAISVIFIIIIIIKSLFNEGIYIGIQYYTKSVKQNITSFINEHTYILTH